MARELDPSWLWGWLWDSIFTIDEPFDNKYYIIAFTTIYVLYKILKAMGIVLVPTTILLGNCLVSLAVLILSVLKLFILVIIPKISRYVFERPLGPFFSTMWNVWEYLAMPSILTHLAMIRFRACQAKEMLRVYLISTRDELYEITGTEFKYPDLPDGDITGIQPSDTGAERWMRQLVEEDNIRRQAQVLDEQKRIAEAENQRMGIENERKKLENERKRIENERTGLVWEGLQSRGPANSQHIREMARLRLLALPRSCEATLAGSFRASDPVSLPPVHEPTPVTSTVPVTSTIPGPLTILGPVTLLETSTAPVPPTTPEPSPAPVPSPAPAGSLAPAPPAPSPPPAPAPADTRPIPRGQDIKRAWEEGWYKTLGPRRTVVKDASTQTEPTDLASYGMKNKPLELAPQTYASRGVQTDLVYSPLQEELESPVVVPELPIPEPSPDPALSEDTDRQTSFDKGKALEGPQPRINANLVTIHGSRAEDEVTEPECSAVSSPLPATITLPDSPEPTTNAEPEPVQTHATGLDRPTAIHSSIRAFLKSTEPPTIHSRLSAAGTSRRNEPGPKSSMGGTKAKECKGIPQKSRRGVPTRIYTQAEGEKYQDKKDKMCEMVVGLLDRQPTSSFKSLETQQAIDTTATSANVPIHSTPISNDDSKHDAQGSPVVRHPLTPELPLTKTTEPHATPESTSVSNVLTSDPIGIASGAQDSQSEASLQAFPEPFSSVVSAENEPSTGYQSTTVYPITERSQQPLTAALIKACENADKKTPLLKVNEDGTILPLASTSLLSNTLSHSEYEGTSIGQRPSSPGPGFIPMLRGSEDIEISLDEIIAASALREHNESDEDIYGDSLNSYNVVDNQQESLNGGPETPAARANPQDSDEEMGSSEPGAAGDPGVGILEEQTLLASTTDDAQMTDVWRPDEEERKRIGDAAQGLFRDLMDQGQDSSEDTKPERQLSTSPMREIANEDTAMQDMQSFAPPPDFDISFQQPEAPSTEIGMTDSEQELAKELIAELENGRETDKDKFYAQTPTDNDPPDPVKEATAEQLATRKIAKPKSRAHKNTPAIQSTLESVSQRKPHTQPETLQQTPSPVNEDSGNDTANADLAARGLLALAGAGGIVAGNGVSNQAISPSGKESSHKNTQSQQTNAHVTNSQKANTHETNVQESSISDHEVERPTATTLPEEQPEPNSQQPQSVPASILPAESQPSLAQPAPTQTPPDQQSPAAASTAAARQYTTTANTSPAVEGSSNTQQQSNISPMIVGGLALPGGNPTLYDPTATASPAPKKPGPGPKEVAEFNRKEQARLKQRRQNKPPPNVLRPLRRPGPAPSTPHRPQKSPNSSTQGRPPSLTATDEFDENKKAEMEVTFGTQGSHKKKQGLQLIDIKDVPDHLRAQIQEHDAEDA
ncbi:hypothetical protein FPCIR_13780 [Fusarium pseudocircinatum]|uniref:Nuclear pore complex NUP2/50/61 domain-containing protein n=1 Tax=Fusarium pseudocircinatum TaxID=56676 RepID=A0A8H5KIL4_9HYPO|nr:hypothetical protein FPCIR_13780 [Fusarium pseudocircinatum]